jgi:hypothetical protein
MHRLTEALTSMPTVVFTALLMFCGVWWVLSMIFAGLDGDSDAHGGQSHGGHAHAHTGGGHVRPGGLGDHVGHTGHGHEAHARLAVRRAGGRPRHGIVARISRSLGLGSLPLSFGLSLFALGGWAVSLVGQTLLRRNASDASVSVFVAIALAVASIVAGLVFVGRCARLLAPIFETETAPERTATTGSLCRIRSLAASNRTGVVHGTADVLNGATIGSTVNVHVEPGDASNLSKGSLAILAAYDDEIGSFLAIEAPPGFEPISSPTDPSLTPTKHRSPKGNLP